MRKILAVTATAVILIIGAAARASAGELFTAPWEGDAGRAIMGERAAADARTMVRDPMPVSSFCDANSLSVIAGMADSAESAIWNEMLAGTCTIRTAYAVMSIQTLRTMGIAGHGADRHVIHLVRYRIIPLGIPAAASMSGAGDHRYSRCGIAPAAVNSYATGTSSGRRTGRLYDPRDAFITGGISPEYALTREIVDRFRLYLYLWEDHPSPHEYDIFPLPRFSSVHEYHHFSIDPSAPLISDTESYIQPEVSP